MKTLITTLFSLILITLVSCGQKEETLEKYDWLLGTWHALDKGGDDGFYEKWYEVSDVKYMGEAWILNEGDTAFSEQLWLELVNDTLYYVAKLSDTYTAKFASTQLQEDFFEVNFPENDFPSTIRYEKTADDKLIITLLGSDSDGKQAKEILEFVRKP